MYTRPWPAKFPEHFAHWGDDNDTEEIEIQNGRSKYQSFDSQLHLRQIAVFLAFQLRLTDWPSWPWRLPNKPLKKPCHHVNRACEPPHRKYGGTLTYDTSYSVNLSVTIRCISTGAFNGQFPSKLHFGYWIIVGLVARFHTTGASQKNRGEKSTWLGFFLFGVLPSFFKKTKNVPFPLLHTQEKHSFLTDIWYHNFHH